MYICQPAHRHGRNVYEHCCVKIDSMYTDTHWHTCNWFVSTLEWYGGYIMSTYFINICCDEHSILWSKETSTQTQFGCHGYSYCWCVSVAVLAHKNERKKEQLQTHETRSPPRIESTKKYWRGFSRHIRTPRKKKSKMKKNKHAWV